MQKTPYLIAASTGLSADELGTASPSGNGAAYDLYNNQLTASLNVDDGADPTAVWVNAYPIIYQENAIIENLESSSGVTAMTKNQLIGEAKFVRAYWNFYLANEYGNVPIVTSTNYKINSALSSSPKIQVYKQIITDLQSSKSLLNSSYLDGSDNPGTPDRVRPTKWAAAALLARAYLYYANLTSGADNTYQNAEKQADTVINNKFTFKIDSLNGVFLKNSDEAIWQIMPASNDINTAYEGFAYILFSSPGPNFSAGSCFLSPQLLNTFEVGDLRKTKWISSYTDGITTWYFPYKYKDNGSITANSGEYTMVLRLGEQYLIRAEAKASQGNYSGAVTDLNVIRNRAGLANYKGALTVSAVTNAIAHERQVELFTEGHRWFDLKRTGAVDSVMTKVTPLKSGSPWQSYQQLYPLPTANQTQIDPNTPQNPGY